MDFTIDTNNKEFQEALQLISYTRQSVFLTGKAGTGKSTFLKYICQCNDITPHYYNLGGAMKIRSATFFMSRGAERKWQRTVFSLSAMLAE